MTITRYDDTRYGVTTGTALADGTYKMDTDMRLDGNTLRSVERRGSIRIGGLITVVLGPKSFAAVQALKAGDAVEVKL